MQVRDNESQRKYRKRFHTPDMFPKTDGTLKELYSRYDEASKRIHASLRSFAGRVGFQGNKVTFNPFDVKDSQVLVLSFLYHIQTHMAIVLVFATVLHESFDAKAWQLRFNAVDAARMVHQERWKKLLEHGRGLPKEPPPPIPEET